MSVPQVAIVTGSSRGIGRGIAVQLAKDGYDVLVNFVSRKDAADEVVDQIELRGGRAFAVQGSVAIPRDRQKLLQSASEREGPLTLLVNNAGITSVGRKDLLEATEESWDTVFNTNLKGPFFLAQLVANHMIQRPGAGGLSGKIINISSISAYAVSTNRADYCMAKSAVPMMTWLLADRLAEYGITVFEISPGVVQSDMTAPVKEKYDRLIAEGLTPIRRWGSSDDVARAVSAIASDAFPFSTGERINVDGGYHIRRL